jgi:hypothetical protein
MQGLKAIMTSRDPGDWVDAQIDDIRRKARGLSAEVVEPDHGRSNPNSPVGGGAG